MIGRFFRWNVQDNVKSNLAILVSPRIILFSEEEEKLCKEAMEGCPVEAIGNNGP